MRFVRFDRAVVAGVAGLMLVASDAQATGGSCQGLPSHGDLGTALATALGAPSNAGLSNEMWATVVDRDGIVCAVVFSGGDRGDQWPGSRVISAQKANTANAFSLPSDAGFGGALSSGNLYGVVLEQGSLLGLQAANPINPSVAYKGSSSRYGQHNDPMTGKKSGGTNVFGGGLALYDGDDLLGGLGVSGDTSCTDHVVAWRLRDALGLDDVPGGVSTTGDDNLIIATPVVPNTFEHPDCGGGVAAIITALPTDYPIGD